MLDLAVAPIQAVKYYITALQANKAYASGPVDMKGLKNGTTSDSVRVLKYVLAKTVKTDFCPQLGSSGKFGPSTDICVKAFQKQNNIIPTGVIDEITNIELDKVLSEGN